jgi:outer membrane murein-binding lipoprotein Lpp
MSKKIDDEINKKKKKLKALTTLTELEDDAVNPKKLKELSNDIKKLEAARKKLSGKKKEMIDEMSPELQKAEEEEARAETALGTAIGKKSQILKKPGIQS